jgi:hypothetical protein
MKLFALIVFVIVLNLPGNNCQRARIATIGYNDLSAEYQDKNKMAPESENSIANQRYHKQNYEADSNLRISISKSIFKKYEPIFIQINYKNISNSNDSIYGLFDSYTHEMETVISDQGNILIPRINTPEISLIYDKPKFILKPNEELILSRSLGYFGN